MFCACLLLLFAQLEARKLDSKKLVADIIHREEAALQAVDVEVGVDACSAPALETLSG